MTRVVLSHLLGVLLWIAPFLFDGPVGVLAESCLLGEVEAGAPIILSLFVEQPWPRIDYMSQLCRKEAPSLVTRVNFCLLDK